MNHNEITWIGTHLGITNDKGGLEAAQTGNFTVVNLAEESRNPTANIFAPLPLFNVKINSLNKSILSISIEKSIKNNTRSKF